MENDSTPINAPPKHRTPEAVEDVALALREHLLWPVEDGLLGLGDRGRAAVACGAVALALGIGIGGYSLIATGDSQPAGGPVAIAPLAAAGPASAAERKPKPQPTLHGATPVFTVPKGAASGLAGSKAVARAAAASSAKRGSSAADTISSSPTAGAAEADASTSSSNLDGPPAGPAALAVARRFADAFVVYETGGELEGVRKAFTATTTPELAKALLRRPPRQPAGVEVPRAKVVNIVPAPSHGTVYPLSVSLLRVGVTSELRLEMEQLKRKGWRVTNVLG